MEDISCGNIYFYSYSLKNVIYFTGPDYSQILLRGQPYWTNLLKRQP
jgi:hypothetical protein